ncbi:HNH endonuclease signature motif containing protein [Microbacterium sp. NPDC076911]|uniref:HNH endonuclease signature motif containing protein n=1 Tax=Microbacterium sp. NPDC076911 TaxID=3154958 RepID=UPI00343F2877
MLGDGAIDPVTARQLLLDAGRFTRVITDPVTGVILDMDRRSRLVTRAQREWLMLTHHLCVRDGCNRVAIDAEIDHWQEYHGPERGATNIANLHPLCGTDHRLKSRTKLSYRRRRDGSVGIASPTGFATHVPWWRVPAVVPEKPPF